MGHKLYEGMPRTPRFKRVVALLGDSAGGGGTVGIAPGGIEEIAGATLAASEDGLQRAKTDKGLAYCVYLMAQVTRAAREENFISALADAGVGVSRRAPPDTTQYSVYDLVGGFTAAIDRHLRQTRSRNDISELAQLTASESLTALCRPRAETLFGTSEASVQESLRALSTKKGFATLTHDFFARLTRRYLEYHLSRELSNHVGPERRFANAAEHNEFLKQLDRYCRVATEPMREFAGEWYSKHNFQKDLTLRKTKGFTAHAIDKVRGALRYQEERDVD
jgi:hypothetical protein